MIQKAFNDVASTWWLDPTPRRPNGVTPTGVRPPRPHLTHLTSNPLLHVICTYSAAPPPFANTCRESHFRGLQPLIRSKIANKKNIAY